MRKNKKYSPEFRLKPIEYKMVIKKAIELKLTNGFTQELSASDEKFVPLWDLKGVWNVH